MKAIKLALGIGSVWLAIMAGSAQAYIIDWSNPYRGGNIQGHSLGKTGWTQLLPYPFNCGWNRSIQMWQAIRVEGPARHRVVKGIALHLMGARGKGTMDLNVYEGNRVGGPLVSSTKLRWITSSGEQWYGFKLEIPMTLKADKYTFAIENLIVEPESGIAFAVDENAPTDSGDNYGFDELFWQYGFASHPNGLAGGNEVFPWKKGNGNDFGIRGYNAGTMSCRINYFFLE